MKKTWVLMMLAIFLALLLFLLFFNFPNKITGKMTEKPAEIYLHSWTKAKCNESQCQDYEIYCNGDKFVNQTPITGAIINLSEGWVDPRNESFRNKLC